MLYVKVNLLHLIKKLWRSGANILKV